MNFTAIFSSITGWFSSFFSPKQIDIDLEVKKIYPEALVVTDVFPNSELNMSMVVIPNTTSDTLDSNLTKLLGSDNEVTFVFIGETANKMVKLHSEPTDFALELAEKLIKNTKFLQPLAEAFDKVLDVYNAVMPGEDLTEEMLFKKVLGLGGVLLDKSEAFDKVEDFYSNLLAKFMVDGKLAIDLSGLGDKVMAMGLGQIANNPAVEIAVSLAEKQINVLIVRALKDVHGEVSVY